MVSYNVIISPKALSQEEEIPEKTLHGFDAAFISGTSPEVLPIASVEKIGFDTDNEILRQIMHLFQAAFR